MPPMPSVTRPRTWHLWERPEVPRNFQLVDRDIAILRETFRHRFATPTHLALLLGASREKIAKRARVLWENNYLERPKALRPTRLLMEELVYGLGPEGARHLAHIDPTLRGIAELDWAESPRRQVGWPYLDHATGVSDVMVALELACRARELTLEWDGHANRRRHRLTVPGEEKAFLSDSYFRLRRSDGKIAHHYLELDRANVSLTRMRDRYAAYFRHWQDRAETEPGYRFRVVTVTTDANYLESLRRIARGIGRDGAHTRTWRGLLFTHRGAFTLDNPTSIFEHIFYYADDDSPVSLL